MTVELIGIPYDASSSFLRGAAEAPPLIRDAIRCSSHNDWVEWGMQLDESRLVDRGDLDLSEASDPFAAIRSGIRSLLARRARPIVLGGDHAITFPVMEAFAEVYPGLQILHFDAHPDLYDELDGDRLSHACPFARIMENGLASRLVQVGIRTMTGHQQDQVARFGVEVLPMSEWTSPPRFDSSGPVYVSIDLDVLDPAFAPGVSNWEPGGCSTRQLIDAIHAVPGDVVGADVVEYNPRRDPSGVTAYVAAKLVRELAGLILRG